MPKPVGLLPFLLVLFFGLPAVAEDNPDELYRKGRFAEAETAYARADMDHPKDVRYRYNRGCAAYRNADYNAAVSAFSSVLRRASEDELRFKASYNLGNTAYKQGDFASAVKHYKQAIFLDPANEDAHYNLELALRELEMKKRNPPEHPEKDSKQQGKEGQRDDQMRNESRDGSRESQPEQESQKANNEADDREKQGPEEKEKPEPQSPEDLSGELKTSRDLPGEQEEDQEDPGAAAPMIDQKKAEALLDNIREDRSRFRRFQIPQEKEHGARSGRDW